MSEFEEQLHELESAEAFLDYFGIDYDPGVVRVLRLHILQRFHDYLKAARMPAEESARWALHARLLERAYLDFVGSDAREQQALSLYRRAAGVALVDAAAIPRAAAGRGVAGAGP